MKQFHVLNLGAGVQSTTLYLMFYLAMVLRGEINPSGWAFKAILSLSETQKQWLIDTFPKLDYAIFADTMDEPQAVYRHLEWMKALGGPPILVRSKGRLSEHLMKGQNSTGQRFASIPAYTLHPTGDAGKVRRQCSAEYKIEVIEKTIRREICGLKPKRAIPKTISVFQYIGISADEAGRATRIMRNAVPKGVKQRAKNWKYPQFMEYFRNRPLRKVFLFVDNDITRKGCVDFLRPLVPHETPRSACKFCPFHDDNEWDRQKREDPEAWLESVAIDHALRVSGNVVNRNLDEPLFLHRSCIPLDLVQLNPQPNQEKAQLSMNFNSECLGVCGV